MEGSFHIVSEFVIFFGFTWWRVGDVKEPYDVYLLIFLPWVKSLLSTSGNFVFH